MQDNLDLRGMAAGSGSGVQPGTEAGTVLGSLVAPFQSVEEDNNRFPGCKLSADCCMAYGHASGQPTPLTCRLCRPRCPAKPMRRTSGMLDRRKDLFAVHHLPRSRRPHRSFQVNQLMTSEEAMSAQHNPSLNRIGSSYDIYVSASISNVPVKPRQFVESDHVNKP